MPKSTKESEKQVVVKRFTKDEIDKSIAKLRRRIQDVESLQTDRVVYNDQRVRNTETAIRETVREVFGQQSPEFKDHEHHDIWHGGYNYLDTPQKLQTKFLAGIVHSAEMLRGLISRLEEKKADIESDQGLDLRDTFRSLPFHGRVSDACARLYQDGHYSEAVFAAAKALENYVKERSAEFDLSGTKLMFKVFSIEKPILRLNPLLDQSDRDEQEGLMHLFAGVSLAVRNPRAHGFPQDTPERAMEYISLLSLLAFRVDKCERV